MIKGLVRTLSFAAKELAEVRRQPRLIFSLIVGPFLILLLFGVGYNSSQPPLTTVLVIPPNSGLPTDRAAYASLVQPPFVLRAILTDRKRARQMVQDKDVDVALVLQDNPLQAIRAGQHAQLELLYNEVDPTQSGWIQYFGTVGVANFNRQIDEQLLKEVQDATHRLPAPPDVIAAPLQLRATNFVPSSISFVAFYTPAVLALLIQHLAITLSSLSIVRERLLGALELIRVAPTGKTELFTGKYIGYSIITLMVGAVLTALLYFGLGVPIHGSLVYFAASLVMLVLASLSVGFLISTLSKSESQAVQLSMILLLGSIFFSGFFLPLSTLMPYVRAVSYILPVTYGIMALKNVMLLGTMPDWWTLAALAAIFVVALFFATRLLKRDLARA